MTKFERYTQSPGNIVHQLRKIKVTARKENGARGLAASRIGSGGLAVGGGAGITIEDGADLDIEDGGEITVEYASGATAMAFGRIVRADNTSVDLGHGLLVQCDSPGQGDILLALQNPAGRGVFYTGQIGAALDSEWHYADELVLKSTVGSGNGVWIYGPQIVLDAQSQGSGHTFITHDTTSNAASCYIAVNGAIQRSTSARKYKRDIDSPNLDALADAALRLRPRTWRDRGEVNTKPATTKRYLGFIAEEVSEDGLDILVGRDEGTGEPEGLAYGQITAPLAALAQRQQREINELHTTVANLSTRLAALEHALGVKPTVRSMTVGGGQG